jgi:adenosylcobinamide-GDP ribazoletransferase
MKKQTHIFLTALMYYTRIRVPHWVNHNPDMLNKATRYFTLIGIIVGAGSGGVFAMTHFLLPLPICILLSMITSILMTGAFHEDGFADVCDGFGGGWTKEKILLIMKDSRVGAFGVIGMILMLLLKFFALSFIPSSQLIVVLIAGHAFSRWCAACIIATGNYVRENEESKTKLFALKLSRSEMAVVTFFGVLPLLLLHHWLLLFTVVLPILVTFYLYNYFIKWIEGYTGDCLGATQQLTEILFYISFLALWKFI